MYHIDQLFVNNFIVDKLWRNFVYIVNVTFPSTKFLDLLEIKITLRSKNIPSRFSLVKDSLIKCPIQPERDTLDLTSHVQDVEEFSQEDKSI